MSGEIKVGDLVTGVHHFPKFGLVYKVHRYKTDSGAHDFEVIYYIDQRTGLRHDMLSEHLRKIEIGDNL